MITKLKTVTRTHLENAVALGEPISTQIGQ